LTLALAGCCSPDPTADFSTPVATLQTFQSAFRAGMPGLEYECFSLDYKMSQGGFDLDIYTAMRNEAIDENPLAASLLSLKDLAGSVTDLAIEPSRRFAAMTLSILGKEFRILFFRETVYRMEFDEGIRPKEDFIPPLYSGSTRTGPDSFEVTIRNVPQKWLRDLPYIRKLVVEERWKFGNFFLDDEGTVRPVTQ
jgi:hypothetical protein